MAQSYTLVRGDEERIVDSPAARVALRYDGWLDKNEVEPVSTAKQTAPKSTDKPNPALNS